MITIIGSDTFHAVLSTLQDVSQNIQVVSENFEAFLEAKIWIFSLLSKISTLFNSSTRVDCLYFKSTHFVFFIETQLT